MYRKLALIPALTLVVTTLWRIITQQTFATNTAYQKLLAMGITLPDTYLFVITTSIAFITLILTGLYLYSKKKPAETHLILAATPAFITAPVTEIHGLLLGLIAAGLLLTYNKLAAILLIAAACVIHPAGFLLALLYAATHITKKQPYKASAAILVATTILIWINKPITYTIQTAELHTIGGFSIIIFLLASIGAVLSWSQNSYPRILALLTTTLSGLVIYELRVVAAIASALLAGQAIQTLRKQTWKLTSVKKVTMYFIALALLFTMVSAAADTQETRPHANIKDFISLVPTNQPVFTLSSQEAVFSYYGVHTTTKHANQLVHIRDADVVYERTPNYLLLEKEQEAQNLRFVLENSQRFELIARNGHELWQKQ